MAGVDLRQYRDPIADAPKRIRDDARLRDELDYCAPRGIAHSTFLSWSEDDQDKALAWLVDQRERCSSCNTYRDEWFEDDGITPKSPPPYVAWEQRDPGCEQIETMQEQMSRAGRSMHGVRVGLIPIDDPRLTDDDDNDEG